MRYDSAESYVRAVLARLDASRRDAGEIRSDLLGHIAEAQRNGSNLDAALERIGEPQEVARAYADERGIPPSQRPQRVRRAATAGAAVVILVLARWLVFPSPTIGPSDVAVSAVLTPQATPLPGFPYTLTIRIRSRDGRPLSAGRGAGRWIDVYPYLGGATMYGVRSGSRNLSWGENGFTWAAAEHALLKQGIGLNDPLRISGAQGQGFSYGGRQSDISATFGASIRPIDPLARPTRLKVVVVGVDHKGLRRLVWTKVVQVQVAGWQGPLPKNRVLGIDGSWSLHGSLLAYQSAGDGYGLIRTTQKGSVITWGQLAANATGVLGAWSPSGQLFAYVERAGDGYLYVARHLDVGPPPGNLLPQVKAHLPYAMPRWSPDGRYVATADGSSVGWIDLADKSIHRLYSGKGPVVWGAGSPDLLYANVAGAVAALDPATGKAAPIPGGKGAVPGAALPSGGVAVSFPASGPARLRVGFVTTHGVQIYPVSAAASRGADSAHVLAASGDVVAARITNKAGTAGFWVWNVKTGKVLLDDGDALTARFVAQHLLYVTRGKDFSLHLVSAVPGKPQDRDSVRVASSAFEIRGNRIVYVARAEGASLLTSADCALSHPEVLYRFRSQ